MFEIERERERENERKNEMSKLETEKSFFSTKKSCSETNVVATAVVSQKTFTRKTFCFAGWVLSHGHSHHLDRWMVRTPEGRK